MRLTARAHELLAAAIAPGDVAVDATAGNGHDSEFLAQRVGDTGHVYSFDIQPQALATTAIRLATAGTGLEHRTTLINACHSQLRTHIPMHHQGRVACAMFNLGYLPGGEHRITTTAATTLLAIRQALEILRPGGILSVLGYTGHVGGQAEVDAIVQFISSNDAATSDWLEIPAAQDHATRSVTAAPRLYIARRRV